MTTQTAQPITVPTFQAHVESTYRNDNTRDLAIQHMRVFSLWYEAKFNQPFDTSLLTNYDFHLYREWSLKTEKVKAATWNSRLWAFTVLAEWLGDPSLLEGVEQQGQVRGSTKHRALTDDEYHRLMHLAEGRTRKDWNDIKNRPVTWEEYINAVRDWASVMLMLHGLRVEEATLVDVDDITINERSGSVLVRNGKGSKERIVPLNKIARKAIASWLDVRPASVSQALFGVTVRTLQRTVSQLGAQIGVPDVTCHWLRYTFAKRLEVNGMPIETIRDLLGHNSIETTRRYLRSSLDELQSAVEGVM